MNTPPVIKFLVVRAYRLNEIKKGLNLRLKSGRETAVEIADNPQANESILFVVGPQNVHGYAQQILHVRLKHSVVRQPAQNLYNYLPQLVFIAVLHLGFRSVQQKIVQLPEVTLEKVQVLRGVYNLHTVLNLFGQFIPDLHT
jgi:hypothetical protein